MITTGYGFWLLLRSFPKGIPGDLWIPWGATLVLFNLSAWGYFIWVSNSIMSIEVFRSLRTKATLMAVLDGGIPILALMGIFFSGLTADISKTWVTRLGSCCGISLCLGGWIKINLLCDKVVTCDLGLSRG
jgi:hypothetical protein